MVEFSQECKSSKYFTSPSIRASLSLQFPECLNGVYDVWNSYLYCSQCLDRKQSYQISRRGLVFAARLLADFDFGWVFPNWQEYFCSVAANGHWPEEKNTSTEAKNTKIRGWRSTSRGCLFWKSFAFNALFFHITMLRIALTEYHQTANSARHTFSSLACAQPTLSSLLAIFSIAGLTFCLFLPFLLILPHIMISCHLCHPPNPIPSWFPPISCHPIIPPMITSPSLSCSLMQPRMGKELLTI